MFLTDYSSAPRLKTLEALICPFNTYQQIIWTVYVEYMALNKCRHVSYFVICHHHWLILILHYVKMVKAKILMTHPPTKKINNLTIRTNLNISWSSIFGDLNELTSTIFRRYDMWLFSYPVISFNMVWFNFNLGCQKFYGVRRETGST